MAYTNFEFVIVLPRNKLKDFTDLLESPCKEMCSYWGWDFVHDEPTKTPWDFVDDEPTKTTMTGKLTFEVKRTVCDVKQWLVSIFGNTVCKDLSVKMVDAHTFPRSRPPPDFLKCKLYKKYGWKI